MKRLLVTSLFCMLLLFSACQSNPAASSTPESSIAVSAQERSVSSSAVSAEPEATDANASSEKFVLTYPDEMQAAGFKEPLELDAPPQRIVCMSAMPVLALHELGAPIVGVVPSRVIEYPADMKAEVLQYSAMSDEFDAEIVVALEPDLVLMSMTTAETHGKTLSDLGIPVYYVYSGHSVPYEIVKSSTQALIDAYSYDADAQKAAQAINARFAALEERIAQLQDRYKDKSVMVLQSSDTTNHYIQTKDGTLASIMDMLGFQNVYENAESSLVLLDMEQALSYEPDLVLCVGATSAQEHQTMMEEAFAANPQYWNSIAAIKEGEVMYMSSKYVATSGINIVENIDELLTMVEAHYGS